MPQTVRIGTVSGAGPISPRRRSGSQRVVAAATPSLWVDAFVGEVTPDGWATLYAADDGRALRVWHHEALTVPAQSIVVRDGHNYVFVIDADNKAGQRKVETGRRAGDRVEVLQGLKADETVAVQGAGFLNEGDLVKIAQ